MVLKTVRLELARNAEFPDGSRERGYSFVAPLDAEAKLDLQEWRRARSACTVHRFWEGEDDQTGVLLHTPQGWAFHYRDGEPDGGEPIARLDRHRIIEGEYLTVTERDGVPRTFRIVLVR